MKNSRLLSWAGRQWFKIWFQQTWQLNKKQFIIEHSYRKISWIVRQVFCGSIIFINLQLCQIQTCTLYMYSYNWNYPPLKDHDLFSQICPKTVFKSICLICLSGMGAWTQISSLKLKAFCKYTEPLLISLSIVNLISKQQKSCTITYMNTGEVYGFHGAWQAWSLKTE